VLKVRHILVVGHYGCGGVAAAADGKRRGLVDRWLHPIREVFNEHRDELGRIADKRARLNRLCEPNVIRQVRDVAADVFAGGLGPRPKSQCPWLGLLAGHRS
jgi:carbonic anhydrase